MVLVMIVGPTKHPFILLLQSKPDTRLFVAISVNAVLLAPIVEELLFRGVLQGWLQSLRRGMGFDALLIGSQRDVAPVAVAPPEDAVMVAEVVQSTETPLVAELVDPAETAPTSVPAPRDSVAWLPILGSSLLFSLAHYSHGPDWVPLLVLAMGLGYLFQRTHRLVPCMTVHFLLNLTSMALLFTQLFMTS
jgi:membrane protease YdiL (CAAX protease family)